MDGQECVYGFELDDNAASDEKIKSVRALAGYAFVCTSIETSRSKGMDRNESSCPRQRL